MILKFDNAGAERMCSGRLFQATGPATQKVSDNGNIPFTIRKSAKERLKYEKSQMLKLINLNR